MQEYEGMLKMIDERIMTVNEQDIPKLFNDIPFSVFGELSLQEQNTYMRIKEFFPPMASEEIQTNWTGSHGATLLRQSLAFVSSVGDFYKARTGANDLSKLNILDFGCGWGRLIRLFYKFIPETQIFGVDAWEESLKTCRDYKVRANLAKIDDICKEIPFTEKFDIVYSFSVFSHLSERAATAALNAIRKSIKDDGVLVLTVRNYDYWKMHATSWEASTNVDRMIRQHVKEGFAYIPHNRQKIDGEVTFGDTSISMEYIQDNWTDWKMIDYKINLEDPYQSLVFLEPS